MTNLAQQPTSLSKFVTLKIITNLDNATPEKKKIIINPIIESNLKPGDSDVLSSKLGEEIAAVVIDNIISSQSSKPRAIVRKSADNIYRD